MSKKWKKRLRRIKSVAIKTGIAVAGAALSTVTGGASAVLAAAALAALARQDALKAQKARQAAAAKIAAGQEQNAAILAAVAENAAEADHYIKGILDGSIPPGSLSFQNTEAINGAIGHGPGVVIDQTQPVAAKLHRFEVPVMFELLRTHYG